MTDLGVCREKQKTISRRQHAQRGGQKGAQGSNREQTRKGLCVLPRSWGLGLEAMRSPCILLLLCDIKGDGTWPSPQADFLTVPMDSWVSGARIHALHAGLNMVGLGSLVGSGAALGEWSDGGVSGPSNQ